MDNLLEILATPKQIGLLIGAGVSKACGLPNVADLTSEVRKVIKNKVFIDFLDDKDNVEVILNKLQQLKSLTANSKKVNGLTIKDLNAIEKTTKKTIFDQLSKDVPFDKISRLMVWLNYINGEYEKEVYTLNYDLLLEKALEEVSLPYFSGFIGNVRPFFISDSVDDFQGLYVKKTWIKLWKIHGSLNFKKNSEDKIFIENDISHEFENLLVYPSMDKYLSSRKAPFISYLDRFRKYLLGRGKLFIIIGYSFGDEHVNEIILNGLNNNQNLSLISFIHGESTYEKAKSLIGIYPTVSLYTSDKKFINRTEGEFKSTSNLGDFNNLINVIDSLSIKTNIIDNKVN